MQWAVVYKKAILDDGTLLFPEKLSHEFLEAQKRSQGSYIFANQYLNEIIPPELQTFKREWFRYYEEPPRTYNTFIYIDPALSEADTSDFTGVVVVCVDPGNRWFVPYAARHRVTPTQLIQLIFRLHEQFKPNAIGIEEVAFQKAILYFLNEEMQRRGIFIPVGGIKPPTTKTKQMRVLSLVPRFEWNGIFFSRGLQDLELELLKFPRGAHDDLIDALASIEYIAYAPKEEPEFKTPPGPSHPLYEKWYIQNLRNKDQGVDNG